MRKANDVFLTAKTFARIWEEHYGEEYYITEDDYAWASKIAHLPLDVIVKRTKVYLKDDYFKGCKHNLFKFKQYINRWIEEPKKVEKSATLPMCKCSDCGGLFRHGESHECKVEEKK
jgi:glycerol-3-phosphate dehydrogenase